MFSPISKSFVRKLRLCQGQLKAGQLIPHQVRLCDNPLALYDLALTSTRRSHYSYHILGDAVGIA